VAGVWVGVVDAVGGEGIAATEAAGQDTGLAARTMAVAVVAGITAAQDAEYTGAVEEAGYIKGAVRDLARGAYHRRRRSDLDMTAAFAAQVAKEVQTRIWSCYSCG
jgi:hypothetical protein